MKIERKNIIAFLCIIFIGVIAIHTIIENDALKSNSISVELSIKGD